MADPAVILEAVEAQSSGIRILLDEFLPEPTLLDPVLPKCVDHIVSRHLENQEHLELLYDFCKVRGAKIIAQLLPSNVEFLPRVLELCENPDINWQERYALLVWLSILVLTPFPLNIVGDEIEERLWNLGTRYICASSKARDATSVFFSRFIARPPNELRVDKFVQWAESISRKGWAEIGILATAAGLCRLAPSKSLISLVNEEVSGILANKLRLKCIGRLGLVFPEQTEYAVAECFEALNDQASTIRYTAAKYLARLAAKVGSPLTEEIDAALSEMFWEDFTPSMANISTDMWQGIMLTLAEMIRVGHCPQDTLKMVLAALNLVQRRTRSSVGANVRDTACYVCWSLFRSGNEMNFNAIYRSLCILACVDRELTVRLAAAAALQEGLGRRNDFSPERTLELLELVNFSTVRSLERCYLEISPILPDHLRPGIQELLAHGIGSNFPELRRLSRLAFPLLQLSYPSLMELADKSDPDTHHGVMLCLSTWDNPTVDSSGWLYERVSTDLECEGQLRLLTILPTKYLSKMNECLKSEEPYVIDAARDLVRRRKSELHDLGLSDFWYAHIDESVAFTACIAEQGFSDNALKAIPKLTNPTSRALAISALRGYSRDSDAVLTDALNDYQWDARGDVGSWVRLAAVNKVYEWKHAGAVKMQERQLWRLAAEASAKVREESRNILREEGYNINNDDNVCILKEVPSEFENDVLLGLCRDYGSHPTKHPYDLLDYGDKLLDLDRSPSVLRTVTKLVELGAPFCRRIIAVAYNATLKKSSVHEGLRMLSCLPLKPESISRMVRLCGYPNGAVRQRAAEALFELGFEDEIIEKTNWERGNWKEAADLLRKIYN